MEAALRFGLFLAAFAVIAALEFASPRRPRTVDWRRRWLINLPLLAIDVAVQRLTIGAAAVTAAVYAEAHGWGLFTWAGVPAWLGALLGFLLLDFAIYLQHVLSHALPVFWRLHQVHHADLDFDLTTGTRFHPLEILISALFKAAVVAAFGIGPWTVIVFEVVLNVSAVFNHGNINLPLPIDRMLRRAIVTPDMHRVHHSVIAAETNSNFGFFLSLWDRLCGTYRAAPALGQAQVELGLPGLRDPARLGLGAILLMPFRRLAARGSLAQPPQP